MAKEKIEVRGDRGVILNDHPDITTSGMLAASAKDLKAGTILKLTTGEYSPAGDSDTPVAVLTQDVEAHTEAAPALVCLHGAVARERLLNASGAGEPVEASNTLAEKLPACGIYPVMGGWTSTDFNQKKERN